MEVVSVILFVVFFVEISICRGVPSNDLSSSFLGADSVNAISTSAFQCLAKAGYAGFVARLSRSDGSVDQTGAQNLQNAQNANFAYIDAYISPCTTSQYCASSAIDNAAEMLNSYNVSIGTLWIDVTKSGNWPVDNHDGNIISLHEMLTNAKLFLGMLCVCHTGCDYQLPGCGTSIGIYTNQHDFEYIVGQGNTEFSNYSLWWANYDGRQDFNNFQPFGGWTKPQMHQYAVNAGACGVILNQNWVSSNTEKNE